MGISYISNNHTPCNPYPSANPSAISQLLSLILLISFPSISISTFTSGIITLPTTQNKNLSGTPIWPLV